MKDEPGGRAAIVRLGVTFGDRSDRLCILICTRDGVPGQSIVADDDAEPPLSTQSFNEGGKDGGDLELPTGSELLLLMLLAAGGLDSSLGKRSLGNEETPICNPPAVARHCALRFRPLDPSFEDGEGVQTGFRG